jgi:hypothetical protein
MPMHYGGKGMMGVAPMVPKRMMGLARMGMKNQMPLTPMKTVLGVVRDVEKQVNRLEKKK